MITKDYTTLERIHRAAFEEFLEKGFKSASLRNIVKKVNMTTGAFYGYYNSKNELFEALVDEHYQYLINCFKKAQRDFAGIPYELQPNNLGKISGQCMFDMLHYAYEHLDGCKLLLCCSEGTKYAGLIDEMVEIEVDSTFKYFETLRSLGKDIPELTPSLCHLIASGMLGGIFEIVIHDIPREQAVRDVEQLQAFYTAGWLKLMSP